MITIELLISVLALGLGVIANMRLDCMEKGGREPAEHSPRAVKTKQLAERISGQQPSPRP